MGGGRSLTGVGDRIDESSDGGGVTRAFDGAFSEDGGGIQRVLGSPRAYSALMAARGMQVYAFFMDPLEITLKRVT